MDLFLAQCHCDAQGPGRLECIVAVALNPCFRLQAPRSDDPLGPSALGPCCLPRQPLVAASVPAPIPRMQALQSSHQSICSRQIFNFTCKGKRSRSWRCQQQETVRCSSFDRHGVKAYLWRVTMEVTWGVVAPLEAGANGMGGEDLAPLRCGLAAVSLPGASPAAARAGDGGRKIPCTCVEA